MFQACAVMHAEMLCFYPQKCKHESSGFQLVEWSHLYASTHHRKALSTVGTWTDDTVYNVASTFDQLGQCVCVCVCVCLCVFECTLPLYMFQEFCLFI